MIRAATFRPTLFRPRLLPAAAVAAALGVAVIVAVADPRTHAFFPRCIFHQLTGLHCPGCGSTRALHSLLHGRLGDAWRMNPLFVLSLPLLAALLGKVRWRGRLLAMHPGLPWVVFGAVVGFGVARNLPGPLAAWLAPH